MVFVNRKLTERTETLPSGTTTYTSPSGQEVISPPVNTSPEHKYVGSYRNPGGTSPCNNCKSVSPPVKEKTSTGVTTDDYVLIGIGILVIIVIIGVMVI